MMWRYYTTILFSLSFVCTATAQQYLFQNYTANDGLVANAVRRIFQDKKGFMWIGTLEGLSKYDGHRFTNYTTANGLSDYLINDFYESKDGTLYVAANDGSVVVAAENKLIPCIKPSETVINRFFQASDGRVLVSTDHHGFAEFRNNRLYTISQPSPYTVYGEITGLNDSLFIIASDSLLQVFTYRHELFSLAKGSAYYFTDCKLFKDSQKRIWAGSNRGLKLIRWPQKKGDPLSFLPLPPAFDIPELKQNIITAIFEDHKQILWIGTNRGLIKMNPDESHQLLTKQDGLADDYISCIFQDREMNIWLGTLGGVSKLITSSGIRMYTTQNGMVSNHLSFVSRFTKDNLLVYSSGGLQTFNTGTEKAAVISNPSNLTFYNKVANSHPPLLLAAGQINSVDTISRQIKNVYPLEDNYYSFAMTDNKKNFFLYGTSGLFFAGGKKKPVRILEQNTPCVQVDRNGFLWAGTWWEGLYRFKYTVQSDSILIHSKEHYFPGERFRSMFMDSRGNLWVGTRQHGVYIFKAGNPADYSILNQSKGLLSDFVKQIAEDKEGNIWMAYVQGIDKLVKKDTGFSVFNFSKVNNFYPFISSMEYDGENSLWLATLNGLLRITDTKMDHTGALPVYITKISSPDSVYSATGAAPKLNYGKNQLQFEFSAPGFINEKQILYSYRLTGAENNKWSSPSNEHGISYASLQPGHYVFEVRSLGWNGVWGNAARFEFTVIPAFWQTWWFFACCALLIATLTFWLVRYRINNIRRQAEIKNKLAETEMAALRAQMNPHFIFNCINCIDAMIQSNDKYQATVYLNKFAKLIRNILDSSKQNIVSLSKDLETLRLYVEMEQFRNENKFTCDINATDAILEGDYKIPPLIIQPFVENAILHGLRYKQGNNGKLSITVNRLQDYLHYVIEDNGVGRSTANTRLQKEKTSYGIDMSYERVKLFNNEEKASVQISDLVENNKPAGTKVEVFLKI